MSTWPNRNTMTLGTGFPHTNSFIDWLIKEGIDEVVVGGFQAPLSPGDPSTIEFKDPIIRSMIEMLEEGFHSGTAQEFACEAIQKCNILDEDQVEEMDFRIGNLAAEIMVQNFKDLLLTRRSM